MACPPLTVIDDETRLLLQQGMYDLTLIDHSGGPTDEMRRIMMSPGVFDRILQELIADRPEFQVLYSDWFSYQRDELYDQKVRLYRKVYIPPGPQTTTYLTFLGVDLGALGGHYAAYYITPTTVEIYDSMTTHSGPGPYSDFFKQLGHDLFPTHVVQLETVGSEEIGLQPTGGFLWISPSFMRGRALSDPIATQLIQTSNVESQDHFCWGWSIFYLHSRLLDESLVPLRQELFRTRFPQVAIIKMYVWLLLSWIDMDQQFPQHLRMDYFSIWDAEDRLDPEDYRRYNLTLSDKEVILQDVDDCFRVVSARGAVITTRINERTVAPIGCLL